MPPVALITGAARRLGAAIAKQLHAKGYTVILHYNQSSRAAAQLCEDLNSLRPDSACVVSFDLAGSASLSTFVDNCLAQFGRLDLLVNNASVFFPTPAEQATEMQWNTLVDCNLKAPFFLSQLCFSHLKKHAGSILNIIDIHGMQPLKNYSVYSITKAGLVMMTKSLAREFAPHVRVNGVAPGPILLPEGKENISAMDPNDMVARTALKRLGEADDVASAVGYLASAGYVTGQVLAVDGGRSICS